MTIHHLTGKLQETEIAEKNHCTASNSHVLNEIPPGRFHQITVFFFFAKSFLTHKLPRLITAKLVVRYVAY